MSPLVDGVTLAQWSLDYPSTQNDQNATSRPVGLTGTRSTRPRRAVVEPSLGRVNRGALCQPYGVLEPPPVSDRADDDHCRPTSESALLLGEFSLATAPPQGNFANCPDRLETGIDSDDTPGDTPRNVQPPVSQPVLDRGSMMA